MKKKKIINIEDQYCIDSSVYIISNHRLHRVNISGLPTHEVTNDNKKINYGISSRFSFSYITRNYITP